MLSSPSTVMRILGVCFALALAVAGIGLFPVQGQAAEATRVVSAGHRTDQYLDANLSVAWSHDGKSAAILRELENQSGGGRILLVRDLAYRQSRDTLTLRVDAGLFHDLSVYAVLPVVVDDSRAIDFHGGGNCDPALAAACVDEKNATILSDGILPSSNAGFGWDSEHNRSYQRPSETVFRGPSRRGIEYLGLGARYAIFNQTRNNVKPTWIVGLESRFAVGSDQQFDLANATKNRAVGPGYHQYVLSTVFSRRFETIDPYLGMWYMMPHAPKGSIFRRYALGTGKFSQPQHQVGTEFGVEIQAWEHPGAVQRINIEARGRLGLRLDGLAQSEFWEPLSGLSTCPGTPASCRMDVDRDLTGDGKIDPNPGVVRSPAYGLAGGDIGLNVLVGRHVRFRGLCGMTFEQSRFLTDAGSGNELYDAPGRRFYIDDSQSWHIFLDGGYLF
jgi:hypothetical protein